MDKLHIRQHSTVLRAAAALTLLAVFTTPARADRGDDQYRVAARHYSAGRWKLAVEEFELLLEQFPEHKRATASQFFLAESLMQLKDYTAARERFAEFVAAEPDHDFAAQARFRVGEAAYLDRDFEAARTLLERFERQHPDVTPSRAYALLYLGQIALSDFDGVRAERAFRAALDGRPPEAIASDARLGLARALEMNREYGEALRFYRYVAEQAKPAVQREADLKVGELLYRLTEYEAAIDALNRFTKKHASSTLGVDANYWLALARLGQEDWSAASERLRELKVDPTHRLAPAIEFALANAIRGSGDTETAEAHYARVAGLWPLSEWADDALHMLCHQTLARGAYRDVLETADRFTLLYPASPHAESVLRAKASALLKLQDHDDVVALLTSLSAPTPRDRYFLALAHLGAGRPAAALEAVEAIDVERRSSTLHEGVTLARATALWELQRYDEAIEPFSTYLAAEPADADARAKLLVALVKVDSFEEAHAVFDEFERFNRDAGVFLSTTLYLAGLARDVDRPFAERLFQVLVDDGTKPAFVARGLSSIGRLQMQARELSRAADTFGDLLTHVPDSAQAPEAALLRGRALTLLGQHALALDAYHGVINRYPRSPQVAPALLAAAKLHNQQGHKQAARALLDIVISRHSEFDQLDAAIYELAWILSDLDDEAADTTFQRLTTDHRDSPFWADATFRLAERALARGDQERAEQLATEVASVECDGPILAHSLYLLGQIAVSEQRWADASEAMKSLVSYVPRSDLVLAASYWIAEADYQRENYADAGELFERLAHVTKEQPGSWVGMIPLRRAQILARREQWRAAEAIALEVEVDFPDFPHQHEVNYLLGRCLVTQARFNDARAMFASVIESGRVQRTELAAMAQWMIGETYFHQKDYHEAIKAYFRVESLYAFPRWQAAALLQAGKCYELQGELGDAAELYATLLAEYPNTQFAGEAAQRLRIARGEPAENTR